MSYVKFAACAAVLVSAFATAAMADKTTAPGQIAAPGQTIAPGQNKTAPGPATLTTGSGGASGGASGIAPGKTK
jgi:hypothetical protein